MFYCIFNKITEYRKKPKEIIDYFKKFVKLTFYRDVS